MIELTTSQCRIVLMSSVRYAKKRGGSSHWHRPFFTLQMWGLYYLDFTVKRTTGPEH